MAGFRALPAGVAARRFAMAMVHHSIFSVCSRQEHGVFAIKRNILKG
jgi:hypothetical protein